MDLTDALLMFKISLPCEGQEIQKRHKELLLKYHPDKTPAMEAWCHERIMEISQARDLLEKHKNETLTAPYWNNHYQRIEEPPEEEVFDPQKSHTPHSYNSTFYLKQIHEILQTYYHYGLDNAFLRKEGVRRFRYREVTRNLEKLKKKLLETGLKETIHYRFIHYIIPYMKSPLPMHNMGEDVQSRRAYMAVRDGAVECEKTIKEYFLSYKLPNMQNFYHSLKIVIVLSATYTKKEWAKKAKLFVELAEAFLALLEYHYSN